jgi:hypothetical protein
MVIKKGKSYYLKKSLLLLLGISLGLIAVLILLVIAGKTHQQVASIVEAVGSFESVARFIRWGVLGAIIMFWDQIVDYAGKAKGFSDEQILRAKTMRWRVAAFIIAFELIVVEAVPAQLLG